MCLDRIERRLTPTNEEYQAYGVFLFDSGTGEFRTPCYGKLVYLDEWLQAESRSGGCVCKSRDEKYPIGFHKYAAQREAARSWLARTPEAVVLPVSLRQVHTIGREGNAKVYVAAEMKVLRRDVNAAKRKRGKPQ